MHTTHMHLMLTLPPCQAVTDCWVPPAHAVLCNARSQQEGLPSFRPFLSHRQGRHDLLLGPCRHQHMLRCVVREDLSMEMANDLVSDVQQCVEWLDHHFIFGEVRLGRTLNCSDCSANLVNFFRLTAVCEPVNQ